MSNYKFPTDIEFRKKAAFIADKVLLAINMFNVTIDPVDNDPKNYCPLGCISIEQLCIYHYPGSLIASLSSKGALSIKDASSFIQGFDGFGIVSEYCDVPMYQLGVAYRKRFSK